MKESSMTMYHLIYATLHGLSMCVCLGSDGVTGHKTDRPNYKYAKYQRSGSRLNFPRILRRLYPEKPVVILAPD